MNRIYQGRVSCVQTLRPITECNCKPTQHGAQPEHWTEVPDGDAALWSHHELFQDAVNYYIVALASLGTSPEGNLTRLRSLLEAVWTGFDKKGQRRQGMGESLKRAWQLEAPPTLTEAVQRFQHPLVDDHIPLTTAEMAAEFLLFKLGGETSIKNNGPVFFPMFCDPESETTYLLSRVRRGRADDEARLREELHRDLSLAEIRTLSQSITLGSVVNLQPGAEADNGESVIQRIREAAKTYSSEISEAQLAAWLSKLSEEFSLPRNRGGAINTRRVHACILFLAFPNDTTKVLFQSTFPAPKPSKSTGSEPDDIEEIQEENFLVEGDDPIKLARGNRGLVFVGYTALPIWRGDGRLLQWKRFDIEAFKEALKVYNQFQQNREKREEKLDGLAAKLLLMDGEQAIQTYAGETAADQDLYSRLSRIWLETNGKPKAPKNEAGEEMVVARFKGDPRITRLRRIITADLAQEYRLTDGRRTPYGLRRRTMKGWPEVRRQWLKIVKPETVFSEELRRRLKDELDKLRSGEKKEQIGSHKLFEALIADAEAWAIWREPDATLQEKINKGWAADPLESFREYCEIREAFEEVSAKALNFTPADARYSRRLFMFTDACSFGKDSGDYKHDLTALAVTVPVATKGTDGRLAEQRCRIIYSAPRLLRDQIRGNDGGYAQDWVQPMMRALFGKSETVGNPQELKDAAVQLMPDYDGKGQKRVLLNFPLKLDESKLRDRLGKHALWQNQFITWKKGSQLPFLRWYGEFDGKEPHQWVTKVSGFHVLAADLGTRHAASVALLECGKLGGETARFIGRTGSDDWFARYRSGSILRLPGENAVVLRPESKLDDDQLGKAFREELYGARGRSATEQECEETFSLLNALGQANLLKDIYTTADLRARHSLPEQNDKLLVAMRRAQNWIAECVSWHWKLTAPETEAQRGVTLGQLQGQDRMPEWQKLAAQGEAGLPNLCTSLHEHITNQRKTVEKRLLALTKRILPLRERDWEWVNHPDNANCHLLRQTPAQPDQAKVKLRGQRGLSMARIEQLSELRRRWQSLNQSLRIAIGQRPPTAAEMRNDPIPDPCPDILRKLENIREQRVNQTAHLIMAEALGLKLKAPELPTELRANSDTHGEYRLVRPPVDFIILEDLSRYLSDQGRAKSENSRLMKWCHRAITLKVKMLAEPFGLPVLETPAAYTSRFCSLTGAAGFRAAEVGWNDRHEFRWRVLLEEAKTLRDTGKAVSERGLFVEKLFDVLEEINRPDKPHRTLLAPQPGGPIFVTAQDILNPKPGKNRYVLPIQADINAAVNIALRAIAHPDCADIHHRLRTERKKGAGTKPDTFTTRESRRFGGEKVGIISERNDLPKEKNTNMFFDPHGIAPFGRARLENGPAHTFPYASGPALWKPVNDRVRQWTRCEKLNAARLAKWERKETKANDDTPIPNHPEI